MMLDFTALLAPAAGIMAALVVLPAALIAAEAVRAAGTARARTRTAADGGERSKSVTAYLDPVAGRLSTR